jgi:hypothetical protein
MSITTIETIAINQLATVTGGGPPPPGFNAEPDPNRQPSTGHVVVDPSAVWDAALVAGGALFGKGSVMQRLGRAAAAAAGGLATGISVEWDSP